MFPLIRVHHATAWHATSTVAPARLRGIDMRAQGDGQGSEDPMASKIPIAGAEYERRSSAAPAGGRPGAAVIMSLEVYP